MTMNSPTLKDHLHKILIAVKGHTLSMSNTLLITRKDRQDTLSSSAAGLSMLHRFLLQKLSRLPPENGLYHRAKPHFLSFLINVLACSSSLAVLSSEEPEQ